MSIGKSLYRSVWLAAAVALIVPAWAGDATAVESDDVTRPEVRARSQVPPYYPATASLSGADAVVVLAAQVGANGKVSDVEVLDCDRPDFGFENAALDAVRHWKFKPATNNGEPVPSETFVTLYIGPPAGGQYSGAAFTQASFGATRPPAPTTPPGAGGAGTGTTPAGELDEGIIAAEWPDCSPGERCIYDRSQLNQRNRLVPLPRPPTNRSKISAAARGR